MKIRNDKLPMARHGRVLALLILIALMLTAGACSKNKPASDPRQVADRFMDLYYVQMNMEEARKLSGGWRWFYHLIYVPRFIRDAAYKLFAKYRYKLFGKKDECMLPSPEIRARFLATN